ncbi:PREDICTED: sodium- and chloride-dependent glycine transporter 1-like [Priapulus caudatus]|uniref:Transporter n=1 Tax=Priapulus caudatus TaxID=37621 RepID=A0ABM1EHV4_PRICU|nr:PREDICTED: sodium- and chloride-dependent glycine transporter 1-like [Priapulus caudatus]
MEYKKENGPEIGRKISTSSSGGSDENKARGNWSGDLDFLLSCIGYAVGIGNVWRFPYICFTNGGGAFLIPYMFALFTCGLPLFFMEVAMGQFSSSGAIAVWNISPIFLGAGFGTVILTAICCIYYNLLIAYILFYLVMSFTKKLPWETCTNEWNTPECLQRGLEVFLGPSLSSNSSFGNNSRLADLLTGQAAAAAATAVNASGVVGKTTTPSEEFWYNYILEITDGLHEFGGIHWKLLLSLFVAYVLVFLCICKGIKSTGKVVYFTATFPYVILTILLVRGATLPGAADGIKYYLVPQWDLLLEFKVWGMAFIQIFYSLGPGWGGIITMSSYNRFHANLLREAYLVPIINSATSVFAGFVVFSVLGYMAEVAQLAVKDVVAAGPGLAFMVYPEAITHLPISPLWAVMFFFMLLMLGLDTQFVMIETVITAVRDNFASKFQKSKVWITLGVCVVMFVLAVPLTTRAGSYLFTIMDWYTAAFAVMVISLGEVVVVAWFYGANRLLDDVEFMIGRPVIGRTFMLLSWKFTVPGLLLFILLFNMISHVPVTYLGYDFPTWSLVFGWILTMLPIIPIPVYAIYHLIYVERKGTLWQRLRRSVRPSNAWGPAVEPYRSEYFHMRVAQGHKAPSGYKQSLEQEMRPLKTATAKDEESCATDEKQKALSPV